MDNEKSQKSLYRQILIISAIDLILLIVYLCYILQTLLHLEEPLYFIIIFGIPAFCSSIYKFSLIRSILKIPNQVEQYLKIIVSIALFFTSIVPLFWLVVSILSPINLNFPNFVLITAISVASLCAAIIVFLAWKIPIKKRDVSLLEPNDNSSYSSEKERMVKTNHYFRRAAIIANVLCFSIPVFALISYLFIPNTDIHRIIIFISLGIPGYLWGTIYAIRTIRQIVSLHTNSVKWGIRITLSLPVAFVGGSTFFIFAMMLCVGKSDYSVLNILIGMATLIGLIVIPLLVWKIPPRKKESQKIENIVKDENEKPNF